MNGVPNNQSNRSILGASLRTTKPYTLHSLRQFFAHNLLSKKLFFISAGTLAFAVPLAASGFSSSNDTADTHPTSSNSASQDTSRVDVQLNHQSTSNSSDASDASSNTSLIINEESIPVTENSSIHRVITNGQQTTDITVDTHSQQSSNSSSSDSSVHMNTQSTNEEGG